MYLLLTLVAKQPKPQPVPFTSKKEYGANPEYNQKRMQEAKARDALEAENRAMMQSQKQALALEEKGIVAMPEEERIKILEGLKKNWEKLNLGYQRLSLTVDTMPKISRKVNMEQQLKEYEGLIDKFSNTNIHVNFNSVYH
jgi:Calmodulin-binding